MSELEEKEFAPTGHFYSAVPSAETRSLFQFPNQNITTLPGLDLNAEEQVRLLHQFKEFYREDVFSDHQREGFRYYFINDFYSYSDAIVLQSMIRCFKPKRYIEVGSGYSSACVLDTLESTDGDCNCTFIEPYPGVLNGLLSGSEKNVEVLESGVQSVDLSLFKDLQGNDMLFIDSTHVSKLGSDVNYLIHQVLPILNPGVLVHFHDIIWPFEYPKDWFEEGRAWNETYMLRAFLQFNSAFKIIFFCTYLHVHEREWIKENMPKMCLNPGGNIWLRKVS